MNINEVALSGIINSIFECNNHKYIGFGLTCQKYSKNENNNQVFVSSRIYEDLYNMYKDFFVKGNMVFIKGYINSYSDNYNKINNFITVVEIFDNKDDFFNGRKAPHIRYDDDGVMVWNGKRCEATPPTEKEQQEMENLLSEYK